MEEIIQEALSKGIELHVAGEYDLASQLYASVIKLQPDHPDANHNMGVLKLTTGHDLEALPFLQTALQANTSCTEFWLSYIKALIKLEKLEDAARILDLAKESGIESEEFVELIQLINPPNDSAPVAETVADISRQSEPNILDSLTLNQAIRLAEKKAKEGNTDEALGIYKDILAKFPKNKQAQHGLAAIGRSQYSTANQNPPEDVINNLINLYNQGQLFNVIEDAKALTEKYPEAFVVWNLLGVTAAQTGQLDKAIFAFHRVIAIQPDNAEAYNNMGNVLKDQGKLEEAIESYQHALTLKPDHADAYNNMGTALKNKGKLEEAIGAYIKAIEIKPDFAEAHNNMGNAFKDKGRLEEALEAYTKALALKPDYAEAYSNLGTTLQDQGKLQEAIASYQKALSLKPDFAPALAQKLHQQARICDWDKVTDELSFLADLGVDGAGVPPFTFLALEDDPYRHRLRSENYANKKFSQNSITDFVAPSQKPKRLRIGYFSADFKEHPVAQLMAQVIETHNRKAFEVYGYSIGPITHDKMRQRLMNAFDVFHDLNDMTSQDIALLARHDKIDIAVDLTGYMQNSRPEIFAFRAAPIQINYLGYPGTMGSDLFDYIIADQNLIPNESQKYYVEKPIYLPHHYQAQDDTLHISDFTPSKSELGLPEDSFVFCAINNTYKITPSEFNIWMRLLQDVDGSVLWLLESNKWVKANLIKEAYKRGIPSERLVFAQRVPHERYLAQFRQADLYLDTFNYNAGATASNALWAGLPVLTKLGKGYTARMAGSLIASVGLSELITNNETEYEKLALELAINPEKLASIKQKLEINRLSKPLFNTWLFTKHLEDGYQRAYQQYFECKKAATIYVSK